MLILTMAYVISFLIPQRVLSYSMLWTTRRSANAGVVPPLPRRVRQENTNTATETISADKYAKITERGSGQYQRFVRMPCY
jgi:hypothetical protein